MKRVSSKQRDTIIKRARGHCEYCRSPIAYSPDPFAVEHIWPQSQGGRTELANLALSCHGCNNCKYNKTSGYDPVSSEVVTLYNPRQDVWADHFGWSEDLTFVIGLTATGRVSVELLQLNREYTFLRQALILALAFLALGLLLLGPGWFRRLSKRGSPAAENDTASFKRIAWLFTFLLVAGLAFLVFLVIEPYFDFQINIDRVYEATRGCCLDPRAWFPFSSQGLGSALYEMAFWAWSFTAFFLVPVVLIQAFVLKRTWPQFQPIERIAHTTSVITSILTAVFIVTIGTNILYWLID